MPRKAKPGSCLTCRKRKIRCDGHEPSCLRCQKAELHCDRSSELAVKQYKVNAHSLSKSDEPRDLLKQTHIAELFQTYIKELAPWYDLNDWNRTFGGEVPLRALNSPLLFSAVIAFSALYSARKASSSLLLAESFHDRCLRFLISVKEDDQAVYDGTALAATCLLRSYEILHEVDDPNRHLFGASTLVPSQPPGFADRTLTAAGFWNFLREDITHSLIHQCPLKLEVGLHMQGAPIRSDDFANAVTLLLARAVNLYFRSQSSTREMLDIQDELKRWQSAFPSKPFASSQDKTTTFPALMMLDDADVAAMHYDCVLQCLLPDMKGKQAEIAANICGLAMFSRSDPVVVNAYGPICFTARWLESETQQSHIVKWLKSTTRRTAWSVDTIVKKLQEVWAARSTR